MKSIKEMKDNIVYVRLDYEDENVLVLNWGVKHIGFGQVGIHPTTLETVFDEFMGDDFVRMIYDYYKERLDE